MANRFRGFCLFFAGMMLAGSGIGLYAMHDYQDELAGRNADAILVGYRNQAMNETSVSIEALIGADFWEDSIPETEVETMAIQEYAGYEILGVLRVPEVGIELPILDGWSYERLDIAPCRYSGSIPEENMVVMGHNYKSHFTPLRQVKLGALVEFEDISGRCYRFSVAEIETVDKHEVEKLETPYPLTLFTCTTGGEKRILVRCEAKNTIKNSPE